MQRVATESGTIGPQLPRFGLQHPQNEEDSFSPKRMESYKSEERYSIPIAFLLSKRSEEAALPTPQGNDVHSSTGNVDDNKRTGEKIRRKLHPVPASDQRRSTIYSRQSPLHLFDH